MRTNVLNGLSNVVKKGTSLACSWRQVGRMSEEGAIEHPLSTHSAPFGIRWKPVGNKYSISMHSFTRIAAMVTLLLTLACGNVWGTEVTLSTIGTDYTLVDQTGASAANWNVSSSGHTRTGTSVSSYSNVTKIVVTFSTLGSSNAGKFKMETWVGETLVDTRGVIDKDTGSALASVTQTIDVSTLTGAVKVKLSRTTSNSNPNISSITITYGSSSRKFKSGEKVFFKDASGNITWGSLNALWKVSTGNIYAYFWNDTESAWSTAATAVGGAVNAASTVYSITVPGSGKEYTKVLFTRGTAATFESGFWNETTDQYPAEGKNMFCISNDGDYDGSRNPTHKWIGTWSTYANGPAIVGSMNNWRPDGGEFNFSGSIGTVYIELEAETSYKFKVLEGTTWYGNGGTIENSIPSDWWGFVNNGDECTLTTAEAGTYAFKWNNDNKKLGVWYPRGRLAKNKYLYFDGRNESNWDDAAYHAKYLFKRYDSDDQVGDLLYSETPLEDWVYYQTTPNNDYVGQVQIMRMDPSNHATQWNYANIIAAHSRTSELQNCLVAPSSGWSGITLTWGTYCPPMTKPTLTDNNGSTIYAGNGTSGNPYIVGVSTSISVSASASTTLDDPDMTAMYDFKEGGTSQQDTEGTTYTFTASSSDNTSYTLTVDAYNTYNSTNSTKKTSDALYYKARTLYTITYNKGSYGTGDEVTEKKAKAVDITLRGVTFTRTGYTQTGWCTNSSGSGGTHYDLSGSYTSDANKTLYPEWTAKTTSVTLNPNTDNHGTGTNVVATATFDGTALSGFTAATPASGYVLEGYYTGATSGDKILNANGSYVKNTTYTTNDGTPKWKSEDATLTLYAHYVPTYTVTYKKNGGASGADGSVTGTTTDASSPYASGSEVTGLTSGFTNSGYKFKWWNKNYGGDGMDVYAGEKFTISANTNLYAQWEQVASGWAFWCGDAMNATYTDIAGNGVTMRLTRTNVDYNTDLTTTYTEVNKQSDVLRHAKVLAIDTKNTDYLTINFTGGEAINSLKLGVCNKNGTKEMLVIYSTTADFSSGEGEKVALNTKKYDQSTKAVYDFSPSTANKYLYARVYMQLDAAVYGQTGGSSNTIRIYSIKAQAGSACSAPAAPTISGTTSYTYGGTISLTATCATGTDASTTYTWYKGSDWATASASSPVQAASTSGATFSKTAAMSDAGTYWCEAANSTCTSHNSSGYAITVAKASISPSLSYSSTTLTTGDNSSSPTVTGNSGSGSVSYAVTSSSPSGCITVDSGTGVVTAVAEGTGTVTATIAATDNYLGGTATADFTVTDPCFYANDLKKSSDFTLAAGGTLDDSKVSGSVTGGAITNSSASSSISGNDKYGLIIDDAAKKVTVTLTSPSIFQAGTVITIGAHVSDKADTGTSKTCGFTVGGKAPTPASKTSETKAEAFTQTYTVVADDGIEGTNHFEIALKSSADKTYIRSIKVTGCGERSGYTVTYDDNGSTSGSVPVDGDSPYDADATVTVLGNTGSLAKNGYTFAGWNSKADGTGADFTAAGTFTITKDTVLYAKWTPNTYDITYNLNGASWAGGYSAPANYTVGTGATLPIAANMTNTGYTFGGWYDNSGLTGSSISAISTSDYGNKEFWAKWTENTYTITYNANGGSGSTTATEGHYVTVADNGFTAPSGKTFVEWNTANDGSGVSYAEGDEIELTADMTLYAIWSKSVGTINWTVTKIDSKLYRGGGGYSIKAEINDAAWDATDADSSKLELTATDGVVLRNIVKSINGSSKAQITANFDITTDVNANATKITFTLSVPENNGYAPKNDDHDESLTNCTGGKVEVRFTSSNKNDEGDDFDDLTSGYTQMIGSGIAKMIAIGDCKISATTNKDGYRSDRCAIVFKFTGTTTLDIYYSAGSSSRSFALYSFSSGKDLEEVGTSDYSTKSAVVSVTGAKASFAHTSVTSSNPSISSGVVTTSGSGGGIKATYSSLSSGYYVLLAVGGEGYFYGFDADAGGGGGGAVTPTLTWDDGDLDIASDGVAKETGDADFTFTASTTSNTLGAITYASSNTSVVTVNATTGKVHIVGAGSATITATLAESGCYEEATATYNITVTDNCDDVAGTIGTEDIGCSGIRMTVTGHTGEGAGATYQWYKDGATIVGATSASYTATAAGEYYVEVTNDGEGHCTKASTNTVTLEASESATASKIVNQWYVKNGRRTPDVALVQTTNATGFYVKIGDDKIWDEANDVTTGFGGCPFRLGDDGIIYLNGQTSAGAAPSGLTTGDVTLKITATACGGNSSELSIVIHKQAATTAKSVAFVVDGTKGGEITAFTAAHATTSPLYVYLDSVGTAASARQFSLTGRNAYWSTVDSTLKAHYSQFDVILITDDPSTQTVPDGVSGKDAYKTKGYINALGALIDVRPILTMEAFVSALANWKSKGINGNPTSPNPRQYAMKLDCKDHEIFNGLEEGANVVATVEDGTTYWTVTMVDKNKSPYSALATDATDYDGTPALQGFSASDVSSLLLLGEISDGAYYAGVERQEEPAARLMLLGLNAKALPNALTEEGKIIIENALTYLLKTNMEEVDDCSNYFTGATSTDWSTATNWSKGVVPNSPMVRARILKPCEISGVTAKAAQVDIVTGGTSSKFKGGSGTCTGKLTINPTGALVVGGEIRTAEAPYYNKADLMPTDTNNLVINTNATNQAALVFNNDKGDTKATVNLYSLGRTESSAYQFQYFAVPMTYLDVNPAFAGAGIYTYVWTEASGWERRGYYKGLEAFEGVGITTAFAEARTYTMRGTLASTEEREITLTTGGVGAGQNIIGNSWLAPINIASLKSALLEEDVDEVVYIYCTGNDGDAVSSGGSETPGQWLAIPIDASGWPEWDGLKVIPAMQGFCIKANSETTLTLNYNDHVRSTASDKLTPYLRAPKREASHEGIDLIRIRVADSQTHTDLYLFEGESFSEEFDNGWEAKYMSGDGRSANLYAETAIGPMAVVAQPEYEGTVLGFAPGKETEYTFTFSGPNKEYYLNDLKEKKSTLISEDESYMFTFEEGDTNRFYISKTPINAPSVATGTENTGDGVKARKVLVNDKLYIILNGRVYSAEGVMVK